MGREVEGIVTGYYGLKVEALGVGGRREGKCREVRRQKLG